VAEEAKPDAAATFYSVRTLNKWFLVSVAAMTVTYAMSVWEDHDRDWKDYQRRFSVLERDLAVRQGQVAFAAAGGGALLSRVDKGGKEQPGALELEIERLHVLLDADHDKRPALEKKVADAQFQFDTTTASMREAKAQFEAKRFEYEEAAHHAGERDIYQPQSAVVRKDFEEFESLKRDFTKLDDDAKKAEAALEAAKAELGGLDALAGDVRKRLEDLERDVARYEKRADSVDRERWFNRARNWLMVNFMAPTETPRKIVVDEIYDDLNFLKIPKVDLCTTCHLASDRNKDYPAGNSHVIFGTEKNPALVDHDSPAFRSHSKPELFSTSMSPHAQERFGCSGCHGGGNQRMEFKLTHHTPSDDEERKVWEEDPDLHWHPVHEWDYPMLGSEFLDASCYKCHKEQVHIPGAAKWNRGRDLVEKFGCFGCHKMAPFEGHRRVGPPLGHVVSKFSSLDFMLKWVDNPANFRPSTKMPAFFHRENRSNEPGRDQAEITALVTFLYNLTTPQELKKYPGNGDAERGRKLMGEMGGKGCLGCHDIDDYRNEKLTSLRHAPDLSGIGSKVTADWLFTWIQDPKSLFPQTNMGNLRLTEQEAADFTAYLMTKRNVAFEQASFEKPKDDVIYEEIVLEKLTERMTGERAKAEIAAMSGLEKRRRAGEFLLDHYGCFGCHEIPGYEDSKPIGTELNGWGSKHADRLDFGIVEMDGKASGKFNRQAWVTQKLSNTRFYDRGKDKKPFEKLKMPQFSQLAGPDVTWKAEGEEGHGEAKAAEQQHAPLSDMHAADREAVITFLLSLVKDNTASSIQKRLSPAEAAVERGRRLVREKNCIGCHILYGEGGEIRTFADADAKALNNPDVPDGRAFYPPVLDGQGARTQPQWLFAFLRDPSQGAGRGAKATLRPWLKARMPTFDFTQEQLNDLVAYFGHEEVWHTSVDRGLWDDVAKKFKADFAGYDDRSLRTGDATKQQLYQALVARLYRKQGGRFLHDTDFPYLTPVHDLSARDGDHGRALFEKLKCVECHMPGGVVPKGKTEADLAPDLTFAQGRLAPSWIKHWLENPADYQPGTRMPGFWAFENGKRPSIDAEGLNDADKEMERIRDYLFSSRFKDDYQDLAKPR
jgi:cbb3-type cytochrome oxidase cytochrome c subunit